MIRNPLLNVVSPVPLKVPEVLAVCLPEPVKVNAPLPVKVAPLPLIVNGFEIEAVTPACSVPPLKLSKPLAIPPLVALSAISVAVLMKIEPEELFVPFMSRIPKLTVVDPE